MSMVLLGGCGSVPGRQSATRESFRTSNLSPKLTPVQMAESFYARIKPSFKGRLARLDAMVLVRTDGGLETRYDFSETVRSGNVRVVVDDFRMDFPYERLMAQDPRQGDLGASLIVTIALQTAFGGARALAYYYVTHRGAAFNREEAIKVTVIGMGQALVSFAPYGRYLSMLVPIVVEWLYGLKSDDFAGIAKVSVGNLDKLIEVIQQMGKQSITEHSPSMTRRLAQSSLTR